MNLRTRTVMVIVGLLLLFVASLMLILNRPYLQLPLTLPALSLSQNIPYLIYLRGVQLFLGPRIVSVIIANGILMLAISLLVFRLGWRLANPRYTFMGATASLLLFQVNPLVILLPLSLGIFGGTLMAVILLLFILLTLLATENWSGFMRALVLAVLWFLFLGIHVQTAVILALAMIPWMVFSRRPMVQTGIFATMVLLGLFLFATSWMIGCAVVHRWVSVAGPAEAIRDLSTYLHRGLAVSWSLAPLAIWDRLLHVAGWLSPFLLILGIWAAVQSFWRMVQDRRATVSGLSSLVSLVLLVVILATEGKDTLPGAWYVLMLLSLWAPLIMRDLALKENFYSRCFRTTAVVSFVVCAGALWRLQRDTAVGLAPDSSTLGQVLIVVALIGGLSHAIFRKHPITLENRLRAVLAGAALAYGLILDCFLFR